MSLNIPILIESPSIISFTSNNRHSNSSISNNWRVPPEFGGTQRNNWTTRAIESAEDEIINTIRSTVERNI